MRFFTFARRLTGRLVPTLCLGLGLGLAASGCLWQGTPVDLSGQTTRLTVLHTSDIHSRLFPFELAPSASDRSMGLHEGNAPFGGVARLGYLIRRERQRSDRSIHLDSGDCFQGAPVFNANMGEPELRFLSMIGLNAAVIGNHEFDEGVHNLADKLNAWASFDVLAANYVFPDAEDPNKHGLGKKASPWAIYNIDGLKVAVIGMANLGSLSSIGEGGNSLALTPLEQNETVRGIVNLVHSSVDLIFVLSHLGLDEDQEIIRGYEKATWADRVHPNWEVREDLGDGRVLVWIPGVAGIDAIIGGHLHVVLNPPKTVVDVDGREVVVCHSGAFAKFLGRLDLVLEDDTQQGGKRIAGHKYQVFPVDERLATYEDAAVSEMLEPYLIELNQALDLRKVIGYAPQTLNRRSAQGNGDSELGNLVARAMRTRRLVNAEFAVTNTLGIRDNLYAGPITVEDMFNVFPFENTLTLMNLSGRETQELVDFIASRSASRGCQSQAQVDGIRFTMNCAQVLENERNPQAVLSPGEDIVVGGLPLSRTGTYRVAVNDYIAAGGSGFRVLKRNTTKFDTGVPLRDTLIDYIGTLERCGVWERDRSKLCEQPDASSQAVCRDIALPGRIPNQASARGPYADAPCVIGLEDGRIRRKTSDNLDSIIDPEEEEEPQP